MKKLLWSIFVLITLLVFIGLTSCINGGDEERPGMKIESELIVAKIWSVSFFGDNGENHTNLFDNVYLQFLPNFRLAVIEGCESTEGEWILSSDSTLLVIRMPTTAAPLNQLDDEWIITKLTDTEMHFIEQDNNGDEEFQLQTAPLRALSCEDCTDFTDILADSLWSVTLLENLAVNQTDQLTGVHLQFFDNGTFTLASGNQVTPGDWAITDNCEKLVIDWEGDPGFGTGVGDLATEWLIQEYQDNFISLEANDDTGNLLHLTKGQFPKCENLTNSLHNTSWYISTFSINEDDVTHEFAGTGLTFLPNNQLVTEVIIGPAVLGSWMFAGECDELILDIRAGFLQELSRQWTILEMDEQQIKLVYVENSLRIEMTLKAGMPTLSLGCTRIINFLQEGSWEVSNYLDNGNDDTEEFEDYSFRFNSDGSFTATENEKQVIGTWALLRGCQQLNIEIDNTGPLGSLNQNWDILYYEDYKIRLVYEEGDKSQEFLLVRS